ncbi:FAD-dependent oxidoreductase [Sorangium cellulosum]|uniref:FAD-dependent oxidoreductase n=1 Tax=Sorangium cellulosum TaxID=56 RepID=A0A4P2QE98_SORCE|nr:FAD-binding oxidoreductase [Sorangium cellulosum]AUX27746.1 FAD-dependent oxidoreductase [Sorangium cellulosum]
MASGSLGDTPTLTHIDSALSVWSAAEPAYEPAPPLRGDAVADVAIVGGGFTGVSTAYHLIRRFPSLRVMILEARRLANGASGRNGGMMLNWINGVSYREPELTRRVYEATRDGIDGIVGLIQEHGLPVRYRRDGCLEVLTDARRAEAAHARAEQLAAWGIPLRYLDSAAVARRLGIRGAAGAVLDETEGQLNGVDLLRGLRPLLLARGVALHEDTPVLRVEEGRTIALTTPGGRVRARALVLATNGYTPRLGYFRSGVLPLHSHVLATEPLDEGARAALGWGQVAGFSDDHDRIAYASMTPAGELVFGGGSNAAYAYLYGGRTSYPGSPASAGRAFEAIRRRLVGYFPAAERLRVAHRWTGTLGITMSRLCSMGVRGEHRNVYYALGYSGHGVVLANLAGRVLCDLYAGDHDRWRAMPFYMARLGGIPPEPLRWLGYQVYTKLTGRSPRRGA